MSKPQLRKYRHYKQDSFGKSIFDGNPTLIIHRYIPPKTYRDAINDVLTAYHSGISFNKAVDQVAALNPKSINRNKLHEHALKTIANDY